MIINEWPEADLTASLFFSNISIVDTNYNKNYTDTIITLWLLVLDVGFVIIIQIVSISSIFLFGSGLGLDVVSSLSLGLFLVSWFWCQYYYITVGK